MISAFTLSTYQPSPSLACPSPRAVRTRRRRLSSPWPPRPSVSAALTSQHTQCPALSWTGLTAVLHTELCKVAHHHHHHHHHHGVKCWNWWARCQYAAIWYDRRFDFKALTWCGCTYNCLSRSVPEIHFASASTLNDQETNKQMKIHSLTLI